MYENKTCYGLNYSQDIVLLQSKYSLFKRVLNIVFTTKLAGGFDKATMTEAINLMIERNDCLRIKFFKEGKQTKQIFVDERKIGNIPCRKFSTVSQMDRFFSRFVRRATDPFKGKVIEAVYCTDPGGEDFILFKICHLSADTYGINVLLTDLFAVYKALRSGEPLPKAPGSFEDILRKEEEYRGGSDARERDMEYFRDYYGRLHPDHPVYCGVHGDANDYYLKQKRQGKYSLRYRFITCDTKGYRFNIPAAVSAKAMECCEKYSISPSVYFMYVYSIAASLINGRAPYQCPLNLLNCRATLTDRKAAGTKVQSISVYTTVDYEKSFLDNINILQEETNELYRHTRLSYLEVEDLQHKQWGHSMISQITNFCFSFIPMVMPEGVDFQLISNGKGALVCYLALAFDPKTNAMSVVYDIQTKMITPEQLIEFQNKFISVLEAVMAEPEKKLSDIL